MAQPAATESSKLSKNQKIALGFGAAAVVAVGVAALGAGGGYVIYNQQKTAKQSASPHKLHVTVVSCSNLIAADFGGTSDPYVVLKIGAVGGKTKVIKKNLNPQFDEEFTFGVLPEHIEKSSLKIEVFDKDALKDDSIGKTRVPLASIVRGPKGKKQEFALQGVKKGAITLKLNIAEEA